MSDYYEKSAEFIDMMIAPWWDGPGALLPEALKRAGEARGPVVDVGAGSGHAVPLIDDAIPGEEILAVEPSLAMRSALFARILGEAGPRERVTVLPCGLLDAELPDTVRAFVLMNVLGHFPPEERARLWTLVSERLSLGGVAVANLAPPFTPETLPRSRMADITVGRNRYEGWARAEPAGEDRLTWTMTYTVSGPFTQTRETVVSYDWWTLTPERLSEETAEHGLTALPIGPADHGIFVVQH
ncbi:class I SAM-dependent methyltransferase [Halostreptopolyspora alba]|uniref:Class I SAM-dependent methyltransferase n=1 Tax=Halostreptopolyspora alba TaxID=2487137 RepID=A0A3N0E5I4_9ACTN|nr:class I SAM-dependent methyltransferase [Nocardiopsaceae bacterium YIM 96095]